MRDLNKRVIDLTAGELLELITEGITTPTKVEIDTTQENKEFVYGLDGIAKLFGCSKLPQIGLSKAGKLTTQ